MNVVAKIVDADKVWPEPLTLELEGLEPLEVAELYFRLVRFGQVVSALKKIAAEDLAQKLQGSALNYGGQIIRSANGRGSAKVADEYAWWHDLIRGLQASPQPEALARALFPASSVRMTGLPMLAAALGVETDDLRNDFVTYDPPTSPLSVMPKDKAPKFLQDLEEGEIR